jgi:hypothetical protein
MSNPTKSLLGLGRKESAAYWGFRDGMPFNVKTDFEIKEEDGVFLVSAPRTFEGIPYVYLGHVASNTGLVGRGTGQGRRLFNVVLDYLDETNPGLPTTAYVVNPVAMALLDEESRKRGGGVYVANLETDSPVNVHDVKSANEPYPASVSYLETLRCSSDIQNQQRFRGGMGYASVIIPSQLG